ncbi:MAG: hypothetical protein ACP5SH_25360 [Syntrophobacteraceae bacterium]
MTQDNALFLGAPGTSPLILLDALSLIHRISHLVARPPHAEDVKEIVLYMAHLKKMLSKLDLKLDNASPIIHCPYCNTPATALFCSVPLVL